MPKIRIACQSRVWQVKCFSSYKQALRLLAQLHSPVKVFHKDRSSFFFTSFQFRLSYLSFIFLFRLYIFLFFPACYFILFSSSSFFCLFPFVLFLSTYLSIFITPLISLLFYSLFPGLFYRSVSLQWEPASLRNNCSR